MADDYALYRHFDHGDNLLYVGTTGDLAIRNSTHIAQSRWMRLTSRSSVERYTTLADVRQAERKAIEAEHPLFNKQHNDTPEAHTRLRVYLMGIGRLDLLPPELTEWQATVTLDASGWISIPELGTSWRAGNLRPAGEGDH